MKIVIDPRDIECARSGDFAALERILQASQRNVYNLAIRVLGHREDAEDATQEILLRITTHLGSWRAESSFSTWVYSVAHNQLMTASTRRTEAPRISFDDFAEALERGLSLADSVSVSSDGTELDRYVDARAIAIGCTHSMLLCLSREERFAYILDLLFGLDSDEAASAQEISATAHRKRLSRARASLQKFMDERCGLVNTSARCRCEKQIPATRQAELRGIPVFSISGAEMATASDALQELVRLGDAAAVL